MIQENKNIVQNKAWRFCNVDGRFFNKQSTDLALHSYNIIIWSNDQKRWSRIIDIAFVFTLYSTKQLGHQMTSVEHIY